MTEKELMLLDRCINSVRLAPYEIDVFISMTNKLGEILKEKEEGENDDL